MNGRNWVKSYPKGKLEKFKSRRFLCDHHYMPFEGHGLEWTRGVDVETDDDLDIMWMTLWYTDPSRESITSFKWRLGQFWKYLRHGYLSNDEFTFNAETAFRMGKYLHEEAKRMAEEYITNNDQDMKMLWELTPLIHLSSNRDIKFFFGIHRGEYLKETLHFVRLAKQAENSIVRMKLEEGSSEYICSIEIDVSPEHREVLRYIDETYRSKAERYYLPLNLIVD